MEPQPMNDGQLELKRRSWFLLFEINGRV